MSALLWLVRIGPQFYRAESARGHVARVTKRPDGLWHVTIPKRGALSEQVTHSARRLADARAWLAQEWGL